MPISTHNSAPGFLERNRKRFAAGAVGVLMLGAGAVGSNFEPVENTNADKLELAEDSRAAKQLEQLIAAGAEVREQAILLHRGVRQRPEPTLTDVYMGKDSQGRPIPETPSAMALLRPVVVTNGAGESFFVMPLSQDELAYVSTSVLEETNDYDRDKPYAMEINLNPESYADTSPSTAVTIKGGDSGLDAFETTLDKAS